MKKIINNFVIAWIVLDLLCLPFVFANDNEKVSKSVFYNENELGYFGKISIMDNKETSNKKENIHLRNNNEFITENPIKEDVSNNLIKENTTIRQPLPIIYFIYYLMIILIISVIRLDSKAQVQMGESIAVLMIFLVLIGLGSIFMVNVMSGSVERTREENMQLKAIDIAQKVSFLPELQCGEENIVVEPCIDMLKLNATTEVVNSTMNDYYPIFEYSKIVVREIFPNNNTEWLLYNKTHERRANEKQIYLPTALYNPTERAYDFGWIVVTVYS